MYGIFINDIYDIPIHLGQRWVKIPNLYLMINEVNVPYIRSIWEWLVIFYGCFLKIGEVTGIIYK